MKRLLFVPVFFLFALCVVSASVFSFEAVPASGPLFKEPVADPYSFMTRIHIQKALNPDLRPTSIKAAVRIVDGDSSRSDYIMLPVSDAMVSNPDKYSNYLEMRLGTAASLARFRYDGNGSFPSIDAEITVGGALNTLFMIFNSSASLGFDGTWMAGASIRVGDMFTVRGGMHHFSGHYGDEIIDSFYERNRIDFNDNRRINADFEGRESGKEYYLHNLVEYVRDNYWIVGASLDLPFGFRVYGEFEWPFGNVWLRPFSSTPAGHNTQDGTPLLEYVGGSSEGFTDEQVQDELRRKTGTGYNVLRAHVGAEFSFSISREVSCFLSMDIQFHQDGQTKHMPNEYSPDNPWDKEFSLVGGFELGDLVPGRYVRIEVGYHNGRVSTTDWFYQRSEVVFVGLSIG